MNLAQEVNILLDDLSAELKKDKSDKSKITEIKNELNNKTKNGNRCRDLFTNPYYVNNLLIDKETNKVSAETDEEVGQKIIKELEDGKEEHRTQER